MGAVILCGISHELSLVHYLWEEDTFISESLVQGEKGEDCRCLSLPQYIGEGGNRHSLVYKNNSHSNKKFSILAVLRGIGELTAFSDFA